MSAASLARLCVPDTFTSLAPVFGTETTAVHASLGTFNQTVPTFRLSSPELHIDEVFCNVTVVYTHPGQGDNIGVEAWLPAPDKWNDVLVASGGGGLSLGRNSLVVDITLAPAVQQGYAAVTTDAGVGAGDMSMLGLWGHLSPGNVDQVKNNNVAGRHLEEQGLLGKRIVEAFYGRAQRRAYFTGCSQGGRQAMMVAQRYPELYDGVLSNAAAAAFETLSAIYWPQQVMVNQGAVPHECEIDALRAEAVAFCDEFDGVRDGVIAEPVLCFEKFDPFSVVGKTAACPNAPGVSKTITQVAANVVKKTWEGAKFAATSRQIWPGHAPGADLTGKGPRQPANYGPANTQCSGEGNGTCVGVPWPIAAAAFSVFLARDLTMDLSKMTSDQFEKLVRFGQFEMRAWDATLDADLREFHRAGGKMLGYHGMADHLLPLGGTTRYYKAVSQISPDVHDFYRYFEVPGLGHCFGGESGLPGTGLLNLLDQLRAWVENGTAPASASHEVLNQVSGNIDQRLACAFPAKPMLNLECGDVGKEECWSCPNV